LLPLLIILSYYLIIASSTINVLGYYKAIAFSSGLPSISFFVGDIIFKV